MRKVFIVRAFAVGALMSALSVVAAAQTCLGGLEFRDAPVQLGLGASFADGSKGFSASLGFGSASAFSVFSAGMLDFENWDATAPYVSAVAGFPYVLNPARTVSLCPLFGVSHTFGPKDVLGTGIDITSFNLEAGVGLGGNVAISPTTSFNPFASASVAYARATASDGGSAESNDEIFGLLSLGIGFSFNEAITIRPAVSIPVGLDGSTSSFSVSAIFALSRR